LAAILSPTRYTQVADNNPQSSCKMTSSQRVARKQKVNFKILVKRRQDSA
jgi:hypothetical protein